MPIGTAQLRARLLWEAACERLRNSLQPPKGAPESTSDEQLEAYRLAQEALEAIRQAFDIDSTGYPPDRKPQPGPKPDGDARRVDGQ